ncbi:MAG: hypothetical protein V3R93_05460 [Candidatus Hydrothermarchaeaceae archaeon]
MKILEILRSEPNGNVSKMIDVHKQDNEVKVVELYSGAPDYAALVDDIFAYDKVICWW